MQMLKDAILERGKALNQDVLLVDSFLNHQVDVALMEEIGEEFAKYFADRGITRVVTIESSGIAPASFTALALGLPLVIMKKQTSRILKGDLLQTTVRSFTKGTQYELTVKREFLPAGEKILLIDDFLASGEAAFGVIHLAQQAAQRSPELALLLKGVSKWPSTAGRRRHGRVFAGTHCVYVRRCHHLCRITNLCGGRQPSAFYFYQESGIGCTLFL